MNAKKTRYCNVLGFITFLLAGLVPNAAMAWEPDESIGNVPFFHGSPMHAQKRSLSFASAAQVQTRLKAQGLFSTSLDSADLTERATKLLRPLHEAEQSAHGVRDERYFLISMEPDVVVIAPYPFALKYKTANEIRGLAENVVPEVRNPMYRQLMLEQRRATEQGLADGMMVLIPNPNYVEIGCAFPDIPGSMIWAPEWTGTPIDLNAANLSALRDRLNITIRRHPNIHSHWQVEGCPT